MKKITEYQEIPFVPCSQRLFFVMAACWRPSAKIIVVMMGLLILFTLFLRTMLAFDEVVHVLGPVGLDFGVFWYLDTAQALGTLLGDTS
jgi:hypothetical protein